MIPEVTAESSEYFIFKFATYVVNWLYLSGEEVLDDINNSEG